MSMNAEIKAQWTAALRSGEYQQGESSLSRDGQYCCLGVLCDLAVKAGVIEPPESYMDGEDEYGPAADTYYLPNAVQNWAGIEYHNPTVNEDKLPEGIKWQTTPGGDGETATLANLNDGGTPFAVIAEIIEAQL